MLDGLKKRWNVDGKDLFLILCVFAVTGTTTAWVSRAITGWAGFTPETHPGWKWLLRAGVLVFGYQAILLAVAACFGQFAFFWRFEKRLLQRLRRRRKPVPSQKVNKLV